MGSFVETLDRVVASELDRLATQIEGELKSEISSRVGRKSSHSTGAAAGAVHIETTSTLSRFIGANINWSNHEDGGVHLYYFDQGNKGNRGGRIYPTRSKALHLTHIGADVYAGSVKPYAGSNVISDVADRHR